MPLDCEILIPEDDSVRLLSQIVEELDLTSLYQAYSLSGRNPAVPPRVMLKITLYAYMEGIYSSRKIENMEYDKEGNFYICSQGNKLEFKGTTTVKRRKSDYESELSTYECDHCMDCPVKSKCTKAKGNRKIQVSHKFLEMREESYKNITSEKGIELRVNRSIQAEGAFGAMKEDMDFRRFLTRGKENVTVEYQLLCLGFNINKLHNKILSNKCGQLLYKVPQAA